MRFQAIVMSTKYKLQYFEARGLGECSRWLFAYAGVAYEDVRFKREQWAEKKQSNCGIIFLLGTYNPK